MEKVPQLIPATTDIQPQSCTVIAFTRVTGVRDGAIALLKITHVNTPEARVIRDARKTKLSNSDSNVLVRRR